MATRIQRRWRGFFSRKYLHDFYARKAFLASIREKNDAVRKQIQTEYEEALVEQERQVEEEAQTQFRDKIMALHHLVSTSASPGIFNSPFDIVKGTIPTVNGTPVEDWLKMAGRAKAAKLPPLQARRQGPPKLTRKTLRASSQYTAVHDAAILEGLVHTATRRAHHERPFSSSVQPMEPYLSTQSIRNLEPYVDPYDPTIGARKDGFDHEARSISPSPFTSFGLAGECD
ncbi:hypothetical protein BSKO_10144 [Bryopsis sp. KO-2023]|nr:hypothetical protein BSKO_10144 [Bryopsis sp. KO-2023]